MSFFQNILVGIDLSHFARLSPDSLSSVAQDLFRRSVWLAQKTSGSLTFFSALNVTEEVLRMLEEQHRIVVFRKIEDEAAQVLADLVRKANESGVAAKAVFVRGQGWLEIIRQVQRGGHDLVMVGVRDSSRRGQHHIGNTAKKLLRRCPAPVWVSRPDSYDRPLYILVASDVRPVSDTALGLAVSLGKVTGAIVHVLHAIDYPVYHLWLTNLPDEVGRDYHRLEVAHAESALRDQLERTEHHALSQPVRVHIADKTGGADEAILECIRENDIDLLVMGTQGRAGAPGVMIGDTAERVLAAVSCSVLAVKPPEFRSSVDPG